MFGLGNSRDRRSEGILERLERLERDQKTIRLEWEETLDKVYRWMKRSQKRDRDEAAQGPEVSPSPHSQHPAVARIMARRGMRRGNGVSEDVPG